MKLAIQIHTVQSILRRIAQFGYTCALTALLVIGVLVAISVVNLPGNYKLYIVQSGSMEPAIRLGSVVVIRPQSNYAVGDIITLRDSAQTTVTHRIAQTRTVNHNSMYVTKGDANSVADTQLRLKANVIGKEIITVPYAGYVLGFAKTKQGLLFLVIIPSVIIIYNELLTIKSETLKLMQTRKKNLTLKEKVEVEIGEEEIRIERGIGKLWRKWIPKFHKAHI